MQPENSQRVPNAAEQAPLAPSVGPETVPHLPPLEAGLERGQERSEQMAEAGARVSDASAQASAIATPVVPQVPPQPQAPTTSASVTGTPLVAADEDLIEKEWVDKAKEIIEQTKDDPHARTAKVNELQRDYLQKRYGKVVGASE
ncbi:MAG TPA: hypothetical protein VN081_00435 [Dongiaceae bacterium]|nr:hypothetical protein [Dongiaceae bacterium]